MTKNDVFRLGAVPGNGSRTNSLGSIRNGTSWMYIARSCPPLVFSSRQGPADDATGIGDRLADEMRGLGGVELLDESRTPVEG